MPRRLAAFICGVTLTATLSAQEAVPPRPRTIRTVRIMSSALGTVRTFGLLLPPDYDQGTTRYPVLYLLHGSGQQHSTWGRQTLLANTTRTIVVMPDLDRARFVTADGALDERYDGFLARELIDYVDSSYRTLASREARAIAGLSIGGFGATLVGLRHPDQFSLVGAFSAPFDTAGGPAVLLDRLTAAPQPLIYIGCGVFDTLLGSNRRFAALLESQGINRRYEEGPGAHTWDAWDWQLRSFLKMLPWSPG